MFFASTDGARYPISRITRISAAREGMDHSVQINDDYTVQVTAFEVSRILEAPRHTFAAAPGTFVLYPNGEDEADMAKSAVVGWALTTEGEAIPITPDGLKDGGTDCAYILTPDGMVTQPYSGSWETVAEFLKGIAAQARANAAAS